MYYKVASSQLPAPQIAPRTPVALQSRQFTAPSSPATPRTTIVLQRRQFSSSSSPTSPRTKVVLQSHQFSSSTSPDTPRTKVVLQSRHSSSSHSPATPRTNVVLPSRQFSSSSSPATPRTKVVLRSRQFSQLPAPQIARRTKVVLERHNLRRALRAHRLNRTLACISRTRHARSPQRVARAPRISRSRLHLAHSTRTISAEGCARTAHIALSPGVRALDTHDLRRGLRADRTSGALACISRTRHARSPQRVARAAGKSHSRLHFAHSTRTISAEGCARTGRAALSPAFRALDTRDLRRGLPAHRTNRTLACISRTRRARSPQRVALSVDAVRPTLRLKERIYKVGICFFIRTSPVVIFAYFPYSHLPTHCMLAYSLHACILITCTLTLAHLHLHTSTCTWLLSLFHLHWGTYSVHVVAQVW